MALRCSGLLAQDIEETIRSKKQALMPRLLAQTCHVATIEKFAIVKRVAWKHTNLWMHAVLCVEEMYVVRVVLLHTDEQTLLVGKPSSFLRENSGRQLLGISDKNTLGAAVLERNKSA